MEKLQYKLEAFEGPLDLLLTLISKNKIEIWDISISEILEQYMNQIDLMKLYDMEVTSDFLDMAARLVYIKSLSLLPKKEEEEKLREELIGQLMEYQQCKIYAGKLSQLYSDGSFVRGHEKIKADLKYRRNHDPEELAKAYVSAVGRGKRFLPPPKERFDGLVTRRVVSVSSQIIYVLRNLWNRKPLSLKKLFTGKKEKSERVAAFLAVLELIKTKRIRSSRVDGEEVLTMSDGGTND